jgi:hypothetical protein
MKDLDRLLSDSLKSIGEAYSPDEAEARQRILRRVRRRRRFLFLGVPAATAVAVAVIAGLLVSTTPEPLGDKAELVLDIASDPLTVTSSIEVGDGPSGMVVGDDGIWVAVRRAGEVTLVDPTSQVVTEQLNVGGYPDDVAVVEREVWVSNPSKGVVTRHGPFGDAAAFAETEFPVESEAHQDIASGFDSVWIAVKGDATWRWPVADEEPTRFPALDTPTDVAVDEDWVWLLGEDDGRPVLVRVDETGSADETFFLDDDVESSLGKADADLAAGEGWVWIALGDEGRVLRIDPATGEVNGEAEVGGDYAGISVGGGVVWVLVGREDGSGGRVVRIDPDSLEQVEDSLELTETPADIVVIGNTAWISIASGDQLERVEPTAP